MSTSSIIQLVITAVILLALVIFYLIKAIKNGWVKKIKNTVLSASKEAEEKWPNGNGKEKRNYVLEKVQETCTELGIPFKAIQTLVLKLLEQIISNYNNFVK